MTDNTLPRATVQQGLGLKAAHGWAAPKDRYAVPVLFNPYTGEPRDVRDVQSDPTGILIVPPGKVFPAAAKEQQAEPVQGPFDDLATELFVVAQISPADDGFSDTIDRIESWLREHFSVPPQHQAEPVALDKIKHCHSKMRLFDFEQHPDHEYAGLPHRPYASSYSEGCYLCATLAEIERLQTKLEHRK